jgi:hypothetical protein
MATGSKNNRKGPVTGIKSEQALDTLTGFSIQSTSAAGVSEWLKKRALNRRLEKIKTSNEG